MIHAEGCPVKMINHVGACLTGTPVEPEVDLVNHPPHYQRGGFQVIEIIEAFGLGFRLGNVVKYTLRADAKGATLQDLKKARWYLDREITKLEDGSVGPPS